MIAPEKMTLTEVATAIRKKKVSSVEVTKAMLERAKRWQPFTNAYVRFDEESALKAAASADRLLARKKDVGPLHGVPMAHKDMYYRAGQLAECGSKIRKGFRPKDTATAVKRLEAAGAIHVGALHMVEFAYGPTGHNEHLGPARNAWDKERITGGSSSGSATAVAARTTYVALGSDTGGSIRLPAHFCGVTGVKPTWSRVSRANAMPLSFSLDTVGPLALSAEDGGLIQSIIAGPDPLDPTTLAAPAWNARAAKRSIKGLTIGVPIDFYVDDLEPDVVKALDRAIKTFKKLGCKIVKVKLPDQVMVSAAAVMTLAVEAAATHATWLRTRPDDYGAQVRNRLENGLAYSAVEYLEALRWRGPAIAAHLEAMGKADVILAPASRAVAPTIAETDVGGALDAEAVIQRITRFMRPVNYLGVPVTVIPAGFGAHGMPIGLQIMGRPYGDETTIAMGRAFQQETDFHQKAPKHP